MYWTFRFLEKQKQFHTDTDKTRNINFSFYIEQSFELNKTNIGDWISRCRI